MDFYLPGPTPDLVGHRFRLTLTRHVDMRASLLSLVDTTAGKLHSSPPPPPRFDTPTFDGYVWLTTDMKQARRVTTYRWMAILVLVCAIAIGSMQQLHTTLTLAPMELRVAQYAHHTELQAVKVSLDTKPVVHVLPLETGWTNYDTSTGWVHAGYYRDISGIVHLTGLVKSAPGSNKNIAVLPVGYRAAKSRIFGTDGGGKHSRIDAHDDGKIQFINGDSNHVTLDGISFLAF